MPIHIPAIQVVRKKKTGGIKGVLKIDQEMINQKDFEIVHDNVYSPSFGLEDIGARVADLVASAFLAGARWKEENPTSKIGED